MQYLPVCPWCAHISVCMCICVCACAYVSVHAYVSVRMCVRIHTHTHTYIYEIYIWACVYGYAKLCNVCVCCVYACACSMPAHVCMCRICACMHMCSYRYVCVCAYVNARLRICKRAIALWLLFCQTLLLIFIVFFSFLTAENTQTLIWTEISHCVYMCVLGILDYARSMFVNVMCACTYVSMCMVRVPVRCACMYGVTYLTYI